MAPRDRARRGQPGRGLYLSFWLDVASGATIVLVQTALFLAILAASPRTRFRRRFRRAAAAGA